MQSFDYISEKLGVGPTLDPFLGIYRTLYAKSFERDFYTSSSELHSVT